MSKLHDIGDHIEGARGIDGHKTRPAPPGFKSTRPPASKVKHAPGPVGYIKCLSATHDPRYQCAPGEVVFGAGFSAVGIGRSVTTGQPWPETVATESPQPRKWPRALVLTAEQAAMVAAERGS